MNHKKLHNKRGFTLIELLVVIAIIGVLSSVVLSSLNSARKKAQDAQTQAEFRQIVSAFELYASDHGGNYPYVDSSYACIGQDGCMLSDITASGRITGLSMDDITTPDYVSTGGGYHSKGFMYIPLGPDGCELSNGQCKKGEAVITGPTSKGIPCMIVGEWQILSCSSSLPS